MQGFTDIITRIVKEATSGVELETHSADRFFQMLLKAGRTFASLSNDDQYVRELKKSLVKEQAGREDQFEKLRIISNVLGLCVMASVDYAQGQPARRIA